MSPSPSQLTVSSFIAKPIALVWKYWTEPEHVMQWNIVSDDWHCPEAVNDMRPGGRFRFRMEALDGSYSFFISGEHHLVEPGKRIVSTLDDGRAVEVLLTEHGDGTYLSENIDVGGDNPVPMQRAGWQANLDRFKAYVEAL